MSNDTNDVKLAVEKADLIKLAKVFRREIEGIAGINHITIHLILPNHESICLTSSHQQVDHYVENKYGDYDHSLISRYTDNLPFYSWEICPLNEEAKKLNQIKKDTYGLQSGMNFVRKIDDIKIIYSVATFITDPIMQFVMMSKANQILEAGDYLFNSFRDIYQGQTKFEIPKIEIFKPFTGGIEGVIPNYEYKNTDQQTEISNHIKNQIAHSNRNLQLIKNDTLEEMLDEHAKPDAKNTLKKPALCIVK